MRFRIWLESIGLVTNAKDALRILGLKSGFSAEELHSAYRAKTKQNHPDLGGDAQQQKLVNAAFDFLRRNPNASETEPSWDQWTASMRPSPPPRRSRDLPPWQTDERSSYNEVGKDFRNLNFCKKAIYDKAVEAGPVEKWTIQAFDGSYFRGVFSAFCNKPTLGFAGMVMEHWNSRGANPYDTVAVFANKEKERELVLIRYKGKDVSDKGMVFSHDSFNMNPDNDRSFVSRIKRELEAMDL